MMCTHAYKKNIKFRYALLYNNNKDFEIKPLETKNLDIIFDKKLTKNVPLMHTTYKNYKSI